MSIRKISIETFVQNREKIVSVLVLKRNAIVYNGWPNQNNSFVCYQAGTMQLHLENPIFPKADIRILVTYVTEKNDEPCRSTDWHFPRISVILFLWRKADIMCKKFTPDELNKMDHETKNDVIYQMQDRLDRLEQMVRIRMNFFVAIIRKRCSGEALQLLLLKPQSSMPSM